MNNTLGTFSAILLIFFLCTTSPVQAAEQERQMLSISVGEVGIGDSLSEPLRFGIDYRFEPRGGWRITPAVGAAFAKNGASFVYVDLRRDFRIARRWLLTPSFGAGLFDDGEELELGSDLEFRSGLELSRELGDRYRLGLAIYHLSNGGIAKRNPGTEALVLSFHTAI